MCSSIRTIHVAYDAENRQLSATVTQANGSPNPSTTFPCRGGCYATRFLRESNHPLGDYVKLKGKSTLAWSGDKRRLLRP
jgi:hypothetical protein